MGQREARVRGVMEQVDGFLGLSFWNLAEDPQAVLGVYEFRDIEAAEEGLRQYSETDLGEEAVELSLDPMEFVRVRINGSLKMTSSEVPAGSCLSLSFRIAAPGKGAELQEDLKSVFDSISLTDGFLGAFYGRRESLSDEVVGGVLWADALAFQASLPRSQSYEVELYTRV